MGLNPKKPSPYHIALKDARSRREWYLQLENGFSSSQISFMSDDTNNIYIRNVGKKVGDFDEQRDWKGGRGGEYFSDDPTRYFDSHNAWTLSTGHVTPTLQWKIATGYRSATQSLPGSVGWLNLINPRYASTDFTPATSYSAAKAWMWVRRVGTPGTLTLEICSDNAGSPGTVLKSASVTTSTITDVVSVFHCFEWTGSEALTSGTTYHIKMYGASGDNLQNHWEVGVDVEGTDGKTSTDNLAWTAGTFSFYYRVVDVDVVRRWFFWGDGTNFYTVDKKVSGASQVYTIGTDQPPSLVEKTTTGLGTVTGKPVIGNSYHFFPQGESTNIRRWNGDATWADDGTNKATYLVSGYDSTDGAVIWKANTSSVARAKVVTSNLVFNTAIPISDTTDNINGIGFWTNNGLFVGKNGTLWQVAGDKATLLDFGLRSTPSAYNGTFFLPFQQFLYFPWLFSLERYYSGQLDDIGQGWKGPALPDGREGVFAAGCSYVGWVFLAMNAGNVGTSSVWGFDGIGWHEVFRAPKAGMMIRDVAVQPLDLGYSSKLWIDCGGDLFYIRLPYFKARPIDDGTAYYQHEGVIISSTIDMGAASKLPKFIKSITANTANLNGKGIRIAVDYQVDDNIGTDTWVPIQPMLISPEDTVLVNAENIRQFRYRMRLMTDDDQTPPDLKGVVLNGIARGETRTVWTMRVKAVKSKGQAADPNELLRYLMDAQDSPGRVYMSSTNPLFHDYLVELSLQSVQPVTEENSVFNLTLISV